MKTRIIVKTTAVTLALTMAFAVTPVVNAGAKAKAPKLNKTSISLSAGQTQKLSVKKNGTKIKRITWSSKNNTVATVNKKGVVKGIAAGKTKVTAKVVTKSGSCKLSCKVKVEGAMEENKWTTAKDVSVKGGVTKLFEKLNLDGSKLEPVATLAYRITDSGTSWRVLSRETLVVQNPVTHYVIAEINEAMDGSVNLVDVYLSSVTAAEKECGTPMSGGWTECSDPTLSADEKAAFEKANETLVGVNYKPVAKIATQVVAGIRYLFACEATTVIMNPQMHYSLITVTVPVNGDITIDQIENIDVPADSDGADTFGGGNGYARLGGFKKPASPAIDETLSSFFKAATAELSADATYTPFALIGERENDGQDFRVFSRKTPTRPGAKTTYAIVEFHTTLLGQSILTDIIDSSIEGFGTDPNLGWAESSTPVLAKGEEQIFTDAVKGLVGVKFDPIAILGTRKTRGTGYCFIAEISTVTANPDQAYALLYANVGEDGAITFDHLVNLMNA